jgi:hypothetical protein
MASAGIARPSRYRADGIAPGISAHVGTARTLAHAIAPHGSHSDHGGNAPIVTRRRDSRALSRGD